MSRTISRGLSALALGGLTSLALISPASAATCPVGTYPPSADCTPVTLTVTATVAGKTITLTFDGFKPFSVVTIVLHSTPFTLGTFTADSAGVVTATVSIPLGFDPGVHTITASGIAPNGSVRVLSAPLTIAPTATVGGVGGGNSGGSSLPFTGFELGAASLLGAGLLGVGGIAVVSGRKRRASVTSA